MIWAFVMHILQFAVTAGGGTYLSLARGTGCEGAKNCELSHRTFEPPAWVTSGSHGRRAAHLDNNNPARPRPLSSCWRHSQASSRPPTPPPLSCRPRPGDAAPSLLVMAVMTVDYSPTVTYSHSQKELKGEVGGRGNPCLRGSPPIGRSPSRGPSAQDRCLVQGFKIGSQKCLLVLVCDGHGGPDCAAFATQQFLKLAEPRLPKSMPDWDKALGEGLFNHFRRAPAVLKRT